MDLDPERFQQIVDDITHGLSVARDHVEALPDAVNGVLREIALAPPVRDLLVGSVEQAVRLTTDLLDLVEQVVAGVTAPIWFLDLMHDWQDVRATAGGAAAGLTPALMPAATTWHGAAADAYRAAAVPQRDAAARIAAIAAQTQSALGWSAGAGISFYLVVGVIVGKLVVALATALAALGSAVFSPAGLALVVEEASVNSGVLLTAATALATALGIQATQMGTLYGEAVDRSTFPDGRWPDPVTRNYDDATVTDGDADWSLRR